MGSFPQVAALQTHPYWLLTFGSWINFIPWQTHGNEGSGCWEIVQFPTLPFSIDFFTGHGIIDVNISGHCHNTLPEITGFSISRVFIFAPNSSRIFQVIMFIHIPHYVSWQCLLYLYTLEILLLSWHCHGTLSEITRISNLNLQNFMFIYAQNSTWNFN